MSGIAADQIREINTFIGDIVALVDDGGTPTLPAVRATLLKAIAGSETFALTGVISPTSLAANQDNYSPTGLATASTLRLTSSVAVNITGIAGGTSGRLLTLINIDSNTITLISESASSTAANRFTLAGGNVTLVGGAIVTLAYDATSSRWRIQGAAGGASGAGGIVQTQWTEVTSNQTTTATTWPAANTTIAAASNGVSLPTGTINVASTTGFAAAGQIVVLTSAGPQIVTYTGTGATTFTGCTGGTGTMSTGGLVFFRLRTTIAAGSNGVSLPTGTINVASTTGFAAAGTLLITTSNGPQLVSYTGTSGGNQFTGCTGGTGTMSTGGLVADVTATTQDVLRIDITTTGGALIVQSLGSASNGTNNAVVFFRVVVDGIVRRGGSTKSNGGSGVTAMAVSLKLTGLTAGAHVVVVQWRVSSGTGQVRPITREDESASLLVEEVTA